MKRLSVIIALAALLCGCGHSPPTRFFTLDAAPPARAPAPAAIAPVQLDAVHIPPALDRPQVVSMVAANRLRLDEQDHWAAPLDEMMRQVLAQDLLARLPPGALILPDAPKAPDVRGIVVDVLQLQAGPGGQVVLEASWTVLTRKPAAPLLTRDVRLEASDGAGDAADQAAAMSRLLGELADRIAVSLTPS